MTIARLSVAVLRMNVVTTQHSSPALAFAALCPGPNVRTADVKPKLREIEKARNMGALTKKITNTEGKLWKVFRELGGVFEQEPVLCTQEAGTGALNFFVDRYENGVTDANLTKLVEVARACTNAGMPAMPFRRRFPPENPRLAGVDKHPPAYFKRIRRGSIFPYRTDRKLARGNLVGIRFAVAARRARVLERWRKAAWVVGLLVFWRGRATYGPESKACRASHERFAEHARESSF